MLDFDEMYMLLELYPIMLYVSIPARDNLLRSQGWVQG